MRGPYTLPIDTYPADNRNPGAARATEEGGIGELHLRGRDAVWPGAPERGVAEAEAGGGSMAPSRPQERPPGFTLAGMGPYFGGSAVAAIINFPLWKAATIGQSGWAEVAPSFAGRMRLIFGPPYRQEPSVHGDSLLPTSRIDDPVRVSIFIRQLTAKSSNQ